MFSETARSTDVQMTCWAPLNGLEMGIEFSRHAAKTWDVKRSAGAEFSAMVSCGTLKSVHSLETVQEVQTNDWDASRSKDAMQSNMQWFRTVYRVQTTRSAPGNDLGKNYYEFRRHAELPAKIYGGVRCIDKIMSGVKWFESLHWVQTRRWTPCNGLRRCNEFGRHTDTLSFVQRLHRV